MTSKKSPRRDSSRHISNTRTHLLLAVCLAVLQVSATAATYQFVDLGASVDAYGSYASAINEVGVVVGRDYPDGTSVPTLFAAGLPPLSLGGLRRGDAGVAVAINNSNQVAGASYTSNGREHAVVFENGRVIRLDNPSILTSAATAINDAGVIVGDFVEGTTSGAFIYRNGKVSKLGFLPGDDLVGASAINRKGQVTGGSANGRHGNFRAFLYQNGKMTLAAEIKGRDLIGHAISDYGDIAGVSYVPYLRPSSRAFVSNGGIVKQFGPMRGDKYCSANDINSMGQVVGASARIDIGPGYSSDSGTAFIYTDGRLLDLNALIAAPGWKLIVAEGINNRGQIAATARNPAGVARAVRLDPVATVQFAGPSSRSTSSRTLKLRGAAGAVSGVARVEYRVGKKGHFRLASGTDQWRAAIKLNRGMNRLSLRTIAMSGESSLPVGLNVNVR